MGPGLNDTYNRHEHEGEKENATKRDLHVQQNVKGEGLYVVDNDGPDWQGRSVGHGSLVWRRLHPFARAEYLLLSERRRYWVRTSGVCGSGSGASALMKSKRARCGER